MKCARLSDCLAPSCHVRVRVGVLTRSLSADGSAFSPPKSSTVASWDAWPRHTTVSRPANSSPRNAAEATMVVVTARVGGGLSGRMEVQRSHWVHRRVLPPLYPCRAPPGGTLLDLHA